MKASIEATIEVALELLEENEEVYLEELSDVVRALAPIHRMEETLNCLKDKLEKNYIIHQLSTGGVLVRCKKRQKNLS